MALKQITYKRLVNLGNFENETIELVADIEIGEDGRPERAKEVFDKLKITAEKLLGLDSREPVSEAPNGTRKKKVD